MTRAPALPPTPRSSLRAARSEALTCQRCPLWKHATQTVFGVGAMRGFMFVGEQPGDVEDREGEPFVGPAGRILRRALGEAGIDENETYLTNVVKHFKWEPRGKRRIHKRPNQEEMSACRVWLDLELERVRPLVLVALGATAASALLGGRTKVTRDRAKWFRSPLAPIVTVTVHPSSILRARDHDARAAAYEQFVDDLRRIRRYAATHR